MDTRAGGALQGGCTMMEGLNGANSNSANSDNIQQGERSVNFISLGRDRHHHPETNIHRHQHLIIISTENFFSSGSWRNYDPMSRQTNNVQGCRPQLSSTDHLEGSLMEVTGSLRGHDGTYIQDQPRFRQSAVQWNQNPIPINAMS
jgi:hypothetical protein